MPLLCRPWPSPGSLCCPTLSLPGLLPRLLPGAAFPTFCPLLPLLLLPVSLLPAPVTALSPPLMLLLLLLVWQ